MTRLIRFIARLYPRSWRERYGAEFEALLDETVTNHIAADARTACNVLSGGVAMQVQSWKKRGWAALAGSVVLAFASWWAGQRPNVSPGTHITLYMDSGLGAMLGLLITTAAVLGVLLSMVLLACGKTGAAAGLGRVCGCGFAAYLAVVVVISLLTPRTIVSIGDGYCYDLWCIGVQQVNATPRDGNVLYTVDVRIFSDANHVQTRREKDSLYVLDEHGRRFPLAQDASVIPLDVSVGPGESVNTTVTFLAPANARILYLTADHGKPAWVQLYLGSDITPFHRRTLLRVL
jgi:hypothetical protein